MGGAVQVLGGDGGGGCDGALGLFGGAAGGHQEGCNGYDCDVGWVCVIHGSKVL